MPIRPKGKAPAPGQPDRRSYQIDVMLNGERLRFSAKTRHKDLAEKREQLVLAAIAANPDITQDELRAIAQGEKAVKAAAARKAKLEAGPTFGEVAEKLYQDHWSKLPGAKSHRGSIKFCYRFIAPDTPIKKLDRHYIKAIHVKMQESGYANGSINKGMSCLGMVMKSAVDDWEVMEEIPRMPKALEARKRKVALNEGEFARIVEEIARFDTLPRTSAKGGKPKIFDAHYYVPFFEFLYETGVRPNEALQLRWSDVEFDTDEGSFIYVIHDRAKGMKTKGKKSRPIPLTDVAYNILMKLRQTTKERPFEMVRSRRYGEHWRYARRRLGLADADIVPYIARHSFATRALETTGDIHAVKELLGHSSIQLTSDTYAHVSKKYLLKVTDAINQRNVKTARSTISVKPVTE